jgi:hypothetical protein
MEKSGQLHASASVAFDEEPPVSIRHETECRGEGGEKELEAEEKLEDDASGEKREGGVKQERKRG